MSEVSREQLLKLQAKFPESEIEWRIGQSGKKGDKHWATVLAYIQSRAVMDRFDQVVGPENWQVKYEFNPGGTQGVVASIGIWIGDEWIWKADGAEQTDIEPFKGGLSGALKRAAVVWGIGRYLYDLEAGFATIVPQGTKGARFAKTKEGIFYWVPPKLPDWALPPKPTAAPTPTPSAKPLAPPDPVVGNKPSPATPNTSVAAGNRAGAAKAASPPSTPATSAADRPISEPQRRRLEAIGKQHGWTHEAIKTYLLPMGIESTKDIPARRYNEVCAWIEMNPIRGS